MEDSLKGLLITLTIIGLFVTSILNFIILFPQEQGMTFSDNSYLTVNSSKDQNTDNSLDVLNNQTKSSFDEWDITQGFMGSNALKQGQTGIKGLITNTYSTLKTIAEQVFGSNSPILYALLVFFGLATGYLFYMIIKFIRTGL